MVHQHFMLIPVHDRGREHRARRRAAQRAVSRPRHGARNACASSRRGSGSPSGRRRRVDSISVGMQQRVEILKALYRGAEILILDEPTAVLTPQEAEELFAIVRSLQAEGKSIIFISHKLNEVLEIADRITDAPPGEEGGDRPARRARRRRASRADGRARGGAARREDARRSRASTLLAVENLARRGRAGPRERPRDLVRGSRGRDRRPRRRGRKRAERAHRRAHRACASPRPGEIVVGGQGRHDGGGARRASTAGMGHIPEDRQLRGLVLDFTLAENLALHDFRKEPDSKWGWLFPRRLIERARRLLKEFDVRGGGPQTLGGLALGRQPAEGRHRARGLARPARPRRGPADARARRRRDRVRPPPARRGARRGPGDPARLVRARGDPLALRPHPRHLRGPDRGRVHAGRLRGGARLRHDRRAERRSGLMTDRAGGRTATRGAVTSWFSTRVGGILVPLAATALAFLIGGLVVADHRRATRSPPTRRSSPAPA